MKELSRIIHLFENCFKGQPSAWHGSSLIPLLENVSAAKAQKLIIPDSHSIWEIVLHIPVWKKETIKCLEGKTFPFLPTKKEWPPINDTSEKAWENAVQELKNTHKQLMDAICKFDPEKLETRIIIDKTWSPPWSTTTYYDLLHGILHHDIYHTGQIAILKKHFARALRLEED